MAARKKPEGDALIQWCETWDALGHEEKLLMCTRWGITYETARHWRSDSADVVPVVDRRKSEEPKMQVSVEEILGMRPAVNLDFVSFDLETSNLTADFSILLCATIKPFGQEPIVFRADNYDTWEKSRANDKGITTDIRDELAKHAIIIAHYGDRFDFPYLKAKMMRHGLPMLPPMFGIDSWKIARDNFKLSSRRLKNLGNYFDIGDKTQVEGSLWMEAAYNGSKAAMDRVVAHNIQDTIVLEKLLCLSFPYLRSIRKF